MTNDETRLRGRSRYWTDRGPDHSGAAQARRQDEARPAKPAGQGQERLGRLSSGLPSPFFIRYSSFTRPASTKRNRLSWLFGLSGLLGLLAAAPTVGGESPLRAGGSAPEADWQLRPTAQVDAAGIYFDKLIASPPANLPQIRLAAAPSAGQTVTLNRAQINELLQARAPELTRTNWAGAAQVKITRRTRAIEETELKALLTMTLQRNCVKEKGDLELRLTRPWPATTIVDELLTVRLLELPNAGVTANCIIRFELLAGDESAGTWQVPVQAHVWREVWVAGSALQRGQRVLDANLVKERRDVLAVRDALPAVEFDEAGLRLGAYGAESWELAENLSPGTALTTRSLRLRPIIRRGKLADAIVQDGALVISIRVEVLEDGLRGQTVRVRNLKSRREFRGKVQNEETIQVSL